MLDAVNAQAFYEVAATCHQWAGMAFPYTVADAHAWLATSFPTWDLETQTDVAQASAYRAAVQQQPHLLPELCGAVLGLIHGVDASGSASASSGGSSSGGVETPTITYDGMGNMDGTTTFSDGGMSYDY